MAVITESEAGGRNVRAFLDMIAHAEGTIGLGDDGYNVIVGGALFADYADHPRKVIEVQPGLKSTAAGRYQFLSRTWDDLVEQCRLQNFGPLSQDRAAIRMFRWAGALDEIKAGKVSDAVALCRKLWASLPNAGYGQREVNLEKLTAVYASSGGIVA
jgi:muramidase (phage lysozyme)